MAKKKRAHNFKVVVSFLFFSPFLFFFYLSLLSPQQQNLFCMETIRIVTNGILCTLNLWGFSTCTVLVQFLSLFIWPFSTKVYYAFHAHIMRQWSQNLFQTMKWFAPGELVITMDESCLSSVSSRQSEEEELEEEEEGALEQLLTRNNRGEVTGISFPERLIMISNHQVSKRKGREKRHVKID